MGLVIFVFSYLGKSVDEYCKNKSHTNFKIATLTAFLLLCLVINQVNQINKNKNFMSIYSKSFIIVLVVAVVHFFSCQFLISDFNSSNFLVSYVSQAVLTVLIVFSLFQVEKKAKEQLGYAFLGLTSAKVILSYVIATQFLFQTAPVAKELKINFFVIFLIFLCLDAYFVIRLLNKK